MLKCDLDSIICALKIFKWHHTAQAQESLNPNNTEFWMDDIYTPGYDTLLRRKEANLRRAKVCKLLALIGTVVAIILIIVIPVCAMGSWRPLREAHVLACFNYIDFQELCAVCGDFSRCWT